MALKIPFDVDDVVRMHDDIIENSGGEFGIINRGFINFTLSFVKEEVIKMKLDLLDAASLIIRDFTQGHPFVDGNKRIAFELVDVLLRENGLSMKVPKDEIVSFMLKVAKEDIEVETIKEWLRKKARKK